jgi:glycosyltransferase involved in cell wall biosynthesis
LYEGSSIVTLEAMAHRRAVVASRAGGLPDKVIPGVTGWLVPPGNEEVLSTTIVKALADPSKLLSMGVAGRALVEKGLFMARGDRSVARGLRRAARTAKFVVGFRRVSSAARISLATHSDR